MANGSGRAVILCEDWPVDALRTDWHQFLAKRSAGILDAANQVGLRYLSAIRIENSDIAVTLRGSVPQLLQGPLGGRAFVGHAAAV